MAATPHPQPFSVVVGATLGGQRLDHFLRGALPVLSRSVLRELFEQRRVRLNGRRADKANRVAVGDHVEVAGVSEAAGPAPDPSLPLRIVYEDPWLVAVDKAPFVPSHALRPGERGNVVSALLARYPELRGVGYRELESGLLHRLDNETSGILLAARDAETFQRLRGAHERGELLKVYLALVIGQPPLGVARGYLRADRRKVRVRAEPFPGAKPIETEIRAKHALGAYSLVELRLTLAARHQVRAHLAALGHPLAGDRMYGGPELAGLTRHFLHASELELPHPLGTRTRLRADLPTDLCDVLAQLAE
ncbi:MAG: RluA family pseudouridine synthase [Polyangiales bacterium]